MGGAGGADGITSPTAPAADVANDDVVVNKISGGSDVSSAVNEMHWNETGDKDDREEEDVVSFDAATLITFYFVLIPQIRILILKYKVESCRTARHTVFGLPRTHSIYTKMSGKLAARGWLRKIIIYTGKGVARIFRIRLQKGAEHCRCFASAN